MLGFVLPEKASNLKYLMSFSQILPGFPSIMESNQVSHRHGNTMTTHKIIHKEDQIKPRSKFGVIIYSSNSQTDSSPIT